MIEPVKKLPELDEPALGTFARLLAALGPDFTLFIAFLGLFFVLGFIYGAKLVIWEGSIFIAAGSAAFLLGARFLYRAPAIVAGRGEARARYLVSAREIMRDWGPFILVTVLFENLHNFTGVIRKFPIDAVLYRMDVRVFGIEPSVWAGRFANPWLTDWFSFTYGLYFFLPMILLVMISIRDRRADFREMATAVVLHMCIGFVLFIVFPAGPPRFYQPLLHGQFQPPVLHSALGLWEYSQNVWDSANSVKDHSSFPSMHCCIALLTLLYAWKFGDAVWPRRRRAFFWVCLPLVVSLWLSTIYLRHHWVPDCVAGGALALFCFYFAPWLRRIWPQPDFGV